MKTVYILSTALIVALAVFSLPHSANAAAKIGSGDSSLLGGDLTDPDDKLEPEDCGVGTAEALLPKNATWVKMTCWPANGPGEAPHQMHPYQSWVGSPASAIVWNKPESKKWYVGFKDGGYGGPTKEKPYFLAIQLKEPVVLTHFTLTTSPDMPDRDPKAWGIQGSNDGKTWTDIYQNEAANRDTSQLQEYPRNETTLFTAFTSADMAKVVSAADLKKLEAKLEDKKIEKADFALPKAYKWFRFMATSLSLIHI